MRRFSPLTAAVLLCGCVTAVSAQQPSNLVVRDDRTDPCRRFHLRMLEPAGDVDHKLRIQKAPENVDREMVWNPCPREEAPLALVPPATTPGGGGRALLAPRFRLVPPRGGQSPGLLLRPRLPSAVEMMRGRR